MKVSKEEIRPGRSVMVFNRLVPGNDTVFFYHGSMATYKQFNDNLIPFFHDLTTKNIVAYDAFGCGESDKPRDWNAYSTDELLKDAIAVFSKYSTSKNVLIGHR